MKKLVFLVLVAIASSFLVSSCGHTTPIIGDETRPFVIKKIKYYSKTHSKYVGSDNADNNPFSVASPAIILPTGMFNINDTIPIQIFKK